MTSTIVSDESHLKTANRGELTEAIKTEAHRIGFDLVGIAPAVSPQGLEHLTSWLREGFAGEMHYMTRRENAYEHPRHVLPNVRSIIMLAVNYNTYQRPVLEEQLSTHSSNDPLPSANGSSSNPPGAATNEPPSESSTDARVARYAMGYGDYHDILRNKLKQLADVLHRWRPECRTRGIVDTAPFLERDFAKLAGLGWFGKNTMLINKRAGSWLFLAALLTDLDLEQDAPHETSHCGTCTRCLEVCPTDAFVAPYVLDARKCISYLTIELRDQIPTELRDGMGDWVFGCDLCQDVCPWNRKAPATSDPSFQPRTELNPANALTILKISQPDFVQQFEKTPLGRPGWEGFRRNAAIALGNSNDPSLIPELSKFQNDPSELVREAVNWAIEKLQKQHPPTRPDSE